MSNPWTPGPWRVEQYTTLVWGACDPNDYTSHGMGYPVAEAQARRAWQTQGLPADDEIDANARLIAAAPEMADTIFKLADWLEGLGIDARHADRFSDETFALVAKARVLLARIRGDAP